MAYCFEKHFELRKNHDEDLDHEPQFKATIDAIVSQSKKIVCIGWRPDTGYALYDYLGTFAKVIVVEAWQSNVTAFNHSSCKIIHGDGLSIFDSTSDTIDCLIWQDGPEHCKLQDVEAFLQKAKNRANAIILATPNGYFPQGAYNGNPWETHVSTWTRDTYKQFGFEAVEYIAKTPYSNDKKQGLIGYWVRK